MKSHSVLSGVLRKLEIVFWISLVRILGNRVELRKAILVGLFGVGAIVISILGIALASNTHHPISKEVASVSRSSYALVENEPDFEQTNTLVIFVDDLQSSLPKLHGVWLLVFHQGIPKLSLMPVFPKISHSAAENDQGLADLFHLNDAGQPDEEFFLELKSRDVLWSHFMIIDESAVKALLSYAAADEQPDQDEVDILRIPPARENPSAAFFTQVGLAMELCNRPENPLLQIDPISFASITYGHIRTNFELGSWLVQPPGLGLQCEFPTIERQAALSP